MTGRTVVRRQTPYEQREQEAARHGDGNFGWDAIVAKVQDPARRPRPPAAAAPRPPAVVADRAPAAGSVDPYNWHRVVAEVMDPERRLTIGELDQRV